MKFSFSMLFAFIITLFCLFTVFGENDETMYMFKFKDGGKPKVYSRVINQDSGVETVSQNLNIYRADYETVTRLKNEGLIENIEEDVYVSLAEDGSSYDTKENNADFNDELYPDQWYFEKQNIGKAKKLLGKGTGVRIAVIDSGVVPQEDFKSENIEEGFNYINPDKTGNYIDPTDANTGKNHGTWVASIICSQGNNGVGMTGIAEDAVIVPLIIHQNGKAPASNVIMAIEDAVDVYDCDIINMSITCGSQKELFQEAVDYANSKGVIVIAAAGNGGKEEYLFPAGCENVISVGSVNSSFGVSNFSQINDMVDIMAGGEGYPLLGYDGKYYNDAKGSYKRQKGTSFSCPVVTGFAALLKEKYPHMNGEDFLSALKAGSVDIRTSGYDKYSGFGVYDAMETLRFLEEKERFFVSPCYNTGSDLNIKVYGKDITGELIFVVYDEDEKLKYIKKTSFRTDNEIFSENVKYIPKEGDFIKVFAFDSFDNMNPLGRIRTIQ